MQDSTPRPCLLTRFSLIVVLAAGIALGGFAPARSGPSTLPPPAIDLPR